MPTLVGNAISTASTLSLAALCPLAAAGCIKYDAGSTLDLSKLEVTALDVDLPAADGMGMLASVTTSPAG